MKRISTRDTRELAACLRNFQSFQTYGSLRGESNPEYFERGELPYDLYPANWRELVINYVVYSYATPIAWHVKKTNEWVIPDVRYSVTTSRHQSRIVFALKYFFS